MPSKKRLRGASKKVVTSPQDSDAAHVATAMTTTDSMAANSDCHGSALRDVEACAATSAERDAKLRGAAQQQKLLSGLGSFLLRSLVIAPDVVGIRCVAVHPSEREMIMVRENGSIVLYAIDDFQNVPHFERIRHTGGRVHRTITRVRYLPCKRSLFLASYLSGQLVLYCGETLTPLHVHQRTGGAIWDFCVTGASVYAAMADGSWQLLRVDYDGALPTLTLQRIIPKVSGADRALSVCCSPQCGLAAGTDDAGNVVAWRLPCEEGTDDKTANNNKNKTNSHNSSVAHATRLSGHETLWTSRLPEGMALCCAFSSGKNTDAPVLAVGTSVGDVVLFDAQHGHVLKRFTHHKGPVSTMVSHGGVFYASGWHESLRSYRCGPDNEWFPAQVKRRTHYHEATELLISQKHQLLFSASRDGTVMYTPLGSLFKSPAMYIPVTTQQFAFAKYKNVLLQTRRGRIEGFRTDARLRQWTPLFAHSIHGKYHLQGLWCDDHLHHVLFATDERAALLRLCWTDGAEDALALHRIDETVALPVGRGVLDCCFVSHGGDGAGEEGGAAPTDSCYVLLDDAILHITLAEGYPVVSTAMQTENEGDLSGGIRPIRLFVDETRSVITVCGLRGHLTCRTAPDGTIDPGSFVWSRESTRMAEAVPMLRPQTPRTLVALTNETRYVADFGSSSPCRLPTTLPHDVRFIARLPSGTDATSSKKTNFHFLATFARGLLYVCEHSWRMLHRCTVEAAFVLKGDDRVLVLLRNLEGTLEALPLCWKVRRFGN